MNNYEQPADQSEPKVTLDPLSFTGKEAVALVGQEVVQRVDTGDYRKATGNRGLIVSCERGPGLSASENYYEYKVGIQWIDREGDFSNVESYTREELRLGTRPLNYVERAFRNRQQKSARKASFKRNRRSF